MNFIGSTTQWDNQQEARRTVSTCSRTCKYWLVELRPFLFERIILRSHDDLVFLLHLLTSKTSPIRDNIQHLEVQEMRYPFAWTHLVLRLLAGQVPSLVSLQYRYDVHDSTTFAQKLPLFQLRVLSASYPGLRSVHRLALSGFRFPSLGFLVRLVGGFDQLQTLHCERLSWPSRGFIPPQRHRSHLISNHALSVVTSASCVDRWSLLFLFCSPEYLHEDEVSSLVDLASALLNGEDDEQLSVTCFTRGTG